MSEPGNHDNAPATVPSRAPDVIAPDVIAQARRRRLKRILTAVLVGIVVGAYTLGALSVRTNVEDQNDLLPVPLEALIVGAAFALGSLPVAWSAVARVIIPVPTFFLYLTVFLGKNPPLPFYAAFVTAGLYSAALTALAIHLAERPERSKLGSRTLRPLR